MSEFPVTVGQLRFADNPLVYFRRTVELQLASRDRDSSWCGEARGPLSDFDRQVAEMSARTGESPAICMSLVRAQGPAPARQAPHFEPSPGMTQEERRSWWLRHAPAVDQGRPPPYRGR